METKSIAIKVGKPLWKAISVAAMEQEKSLAEVVIPVLEKAFSVEAVDLRRRADGLRSRLEEVVKTRPEPVSAPKQPVSEFLCKICGKPTKGDFLCPTCKK